MKHKKYSQCSHRHSYMTFGKRSPDEPPLDEPVQPCLLNHVRMSDICGFTDIQNIVESSERLISDFIPKKSEISKFSQVSMFNCWK